MLSEKRILIAPLNWGLGHASRCIPIVRKLLADGKEVILAADGEPLKLLQEEFPQLPSILLKGITIRYPQKISFPLYFGLKMPQLIRSVRYEQQQIQSIVKEHQIEAIISDNRYGLVHEKVKSILITHQLFVKSPWFEKQIHRYVHKLILKFDECWVPDYEENGGLSGDLSHGFAIPKNVRYIGPLSRFNHQKNSTHVPERKLIAILSGPEPHRSKFEHKILQQIKKADIHALVVRGVLGSRRSREDKNGKIEVLNNLPSNEMEKEIMRSEYVLCRAGYSSIMDLHALDKKAIIVPTRGQTEQEYLAKHLKSNQNFLAVEEGRLDLVSDLERLSRK